MGHHHSGRCAYPLNLADYRPHQLSGRLGSLSGDLTRLVRGLKARVQLNVELFGDDKAGAVFEGVYIVLPAQPADPLEQGGSEAG